MKKIDLINLIKEEVKKEKTEKKMFSGLKTISKDLEDQKSNFDLIKTKDKMISFLNLMVDKIDPKFKESPAFKQAIIAFYNKHK